MLDTTVLLAAFLLASAFTLLLAAMLYPSALLRWFQRKRYQYEVTFSLYMLTSTEKFIFSTLAPLTCRRMQNRILSCFLECGDSPPLSYLSLSLSVNATLPLHTHTHTLPLVHACRFEKLTISTDSVLFLLLSLLIIAASLYLPEHLTIIANRMSYYLSGNRDALANSTPKDVGMPNAPLGAGAMGNGRGMMEL